MHAVYSHKFTVFYIYFSNNLQNLRDVYFVLQKCNFKDCNLAGCMLSKSKFCISQKLYKYRNAY